jgi:thiol-disulfide isomerase/thioredoxin
MKKEGKYMRMRTVFVVFALLLAVGCVLAAPQTPAPTDPKIIDAQAYQKLLEQNRGKPMLINFWATWCEPCRDEYPMLNDLAKQYGPKGLKVLGVNFDQDGDIILMRRFIARYKPVFPNYRNPGGGSEFQQAAMPGWNGALPATILYDKTGRQVGHYVGAQTRVTYESAIQSLLTPQ